MKDLTTLHLMIFMLICVLSEVAVLLLPSSLEWTHRSLVLPPVIVMAMGAVYVMLMRKGKMQSIRNMVIYKALKLIVMAVVVGLFIGVADTSKGQKIAFLMVAFVSYILTLAAETYVFVDYQKNKTNESNSI